MPATLLALCSMFAAAPCAAQPASESSGRLSIERIEVGLDGQYKLGNWTAVRVTIAGGEENVRGRVELTTSDGDGLAASYSPGEDALVEIPAGGEVTVTRYVKFGRAGSDLRVGLFDGERQLAARKFSAAEFPPALSATQLLLLQIGPSIGIDATVERRLRNDAGLPATARIDDWSVLPDRWIGYEGVDALIVAASNPAQIAGLSDEQVDALLRWIRLGGRVMLCAGAKGDEVFSPGAPLAELAPGTFVEVRQQRGTSRLESFAGASQRLDTAGGGVRRGFAVPQTILTDIDGRVVVAEGFGDDVQPIVIRSAYGLGVVVLTTFDLDQPPFSEWSDRPQLVSKILAELFAEQTDVRLGGQRGGVTQVGYTDLIGQLRAALEQFDGADGVPLVPFSLVAALIAGYLLLIGPIDYLLLHRVVKRTHWTWVTFPAVVIGFCVLSYYLFLNLKGERLRINQVEVVDIDAASGIARGVAWAHVYSPRSERFNLDLDVEFPSDQSGPPVDALLTWQGLPGTGLGGMSSKGGSGWESEAYTIFTDPSAAAGKSRGIAGMPFDCAATKSLVGRWQAERPLEPSWELTADADGVLQGRIVNPLSVELTDCVLYHQNWAFPFDGVIAPNQSLRVGGQPFDMQWRLTRRRTTFEESKRSGAYESAAWNPASFEVPRIMELLMFHDAAGGESYTRLSHRYQPYLDLSKLLHSGRAVLVGRARTPIATLQRDGASLDDDYHQHWAFCRIVFPVTATNVRPTYMETDE